MAAGIASRARAWEEDAGSPSAKVLSRTRSLRWWAWSWGRKQPVYVLVAEEDATARRNIANTLRDAGYNVVEASDGPDLVDLLRAWFYPGTHAAPVDVIVANATLFPPRSSGVRAEKAFPAEASSTPVLWIGCPNVKGNGGAGDGAGILAAVDRLVGRGGPAR